MMWQTRQTPSPVNDVLRRALLTISVTYRNFPVVAHTDRSKPLFHPAQLSHRTSRVIHMHEVRGALAVVLALSRILETQT